MPADDAPAATVVGEMAAPPIVLATDFGLADAYVGMMRGTILGINPGVTIIDLTHGIGAQDIRHGAVVLADSFRHFPDGSIFVAVVDPGVGTAREAILLETPHARFLAPDNGLLTLVCRQYDAGFGDAAHAGSAPVPDGCRAWRLTNPTYWKHPVSTTFHGRDVFAPVAAHLSRGVPPVELGEPVNRVAALGVPIRRVEGNAVSGAVVYVDAFGNLVTDITADILADLGVAVGDPAVFISIVGHTIAGLSRTFHDPAATGLRALLGSHGRLEIVVVDGSAAEALGVGAGERVGVRLC